ncbi:MAG: alginate lyase family protein [Candidatus Methylacidiphilales bacterium]|nr:alginate lyase family protein [Candidatus Methylacidiphilales bacterium]
MEPGEFALRSVLPLERRQYERLRALVAQDREAARQLQALRFETAPWIASKPNPLRVIRYEGLVDTDPGRRADVENLRTLDHVAALLLLWQATGDEAAARTVMDHVRAWSATYVPTGNDVNENKLAPLLVAALTFRSSFSRDDLARIDTWIHDIGRLHAEGLGGAPDRGNRFAKRLRLLALCAAWSGNDVWWQDCRRGFTAFVDKSLFEDGGSYDLQMRDSLTYHLSGLLSVIELLHSLGPDAGRLYHSVSARGSSVRKSVHYLIPYVLGEKQRQEWVHSKVGLDHARAAAGLEAYRPGRYYNGRDALPLLEMAARFDEELRMRLPELRTIHKMEMPDWACLITTACDRGNPVRPGFR